MIQAIRSKRWAEEPRLVYADWLESRGDPRAEFIRIDLAMRTLEPDHPAWARAEDELSRARLVCDLDWAAQIETPARPSFLPDGRPCACVVRSRPRAPANVLHRQRQDTQSPGWRRLPDPPR